MSQPSRQPATVVRHLPGHAADLVAAVALLLSLFVVSLTDQVLTPTALVVLAAVALGVRGLAGLAVAWVVDSW